MLTIESMPVDGKQRLTADMKKALQKQVESVLDTQSTIVQAKRAQERDKLIREYEKLVGKQQLLDSKARLQLEIEKIDEELGSLGFGGYDKTFSVHDAYKGGGCRVNKTAQRVVQSIKALLDEPETALRAKLIARLWMAKTVAEAQVIFNEVCGNGIMPTVAQLPETTE